MEDLMKTNSKNPTTFLERSARFLGMVVTLALVVQAAAFSQSSPAPVNLGTAGDFVALAKTGISATGTTAITGDIGVSPAAATYITGFGLILDPSGTFSISTLVNGKIYAADYASPTPTKLTTAVSDMETAYTDAAGRTTPDHTELYAGDLTGQTLTHGLYKWGTGVLVAAGGVTISGSASDVWIFQIAQDLTIANGAIVTLSGEAQSSNIFWQVAGQVTLGTTSEMKGNILCQTQIAMSTGSVLDGVALAQTAVTLDANGVTKPSLGNLATLTLLATVPAEGDTTVSLDNKLAGIFSLPMDGSTLTSSTFTLTGPTSLVSGTVTDTGRIAYFSPASNLAPNTVYTATITTGAKDVAGIGLAGNHVWSFRTGSGVTAVKNKLAAPNLFALSQNYPNPFNPSTVISYQLPVNSQVTLKVYDMLGREVATLVNGEMKAGSYTATFNTATATHVLASGVYVYRLQAGSFISTKKLILMK